MQLAPLAWFLALGLGLPTSAGSSVPHDPAERLAWLNVRIQRTPDVAALYLERGEILRGQLEFASALQDYDHALSLDGELHAARLARGEVLLAVGRAREALTSFDRCLECEALGARAIWLAGTACAAIGEFERAEFEMSRAMAAMSRRTPSHYLARAAVQRQLPNGGVDRAVDGIDAGMLELGPIVTLVDRAVELEIARGRHAEALTRIDSVIRRLTRRASWLARRAEVLEHLERPLEAAATRRAAVSEIDALPPRHRDSRATRELRRAIVAAGPLADSGSIELVPLPRRDLGAARAVTAPLPTFTNLVPYGSTWEYLDDGSDPGTAWRDVSFAPTVPWSTGAAPLGYGDNEATAISFGPNPAARYITYYFRHVFSVTGAAALTGARFRLVRDDGAVVYLNGVEVGRTNMPGSSDATTLAPLDVDGLYEGVPHDLILDHSLLVDGDNVLAVEVHQSSPSSADLRFDGEFLVNDEIVTLTRGPYLQRVSPDSAVIRWRTSGATDSSVWIGPAPGSLVVAATDPALRSDHEVLVSGLAAATDYYYAVGSVGGMLAGDTADHSFRTHPTIGSSVPTRIWAIGDSGTANLDAGAVRDAYLGYAAGAHTDVWLMLGDNAYFSGFDLEYQVAVFDMYSELLRNTCVWPTIGNHDAYTADSDSMTGAYYDIFTLPMAGESGGLASGTEAYYSFDHGDIHFVCLDSQDTDRSATGAMFTWLRQDLQNTLANWVIAFWHHPPYSKGSHDTDNPFDSGGRSWDMRGEALPILEEAGVDLVLCGHSHSYERSYLLNGHYKTSSTLAPEHVLDSGDGDPAVDGEYAKATLGIAPAEGAVYVVAGSSGIVGPGTLDHPAMCVSLSELGSMVIDVDGAVLDARFLDDTGAVHDHFRIRKGVTRSLTRDVPRISAVSGGEQNFSLDAGLAHAGMSYLLLGSFGSEPGFDLGPVHVPLNPDSWTALTKERANGSRFVNTSGVLNARGRGWAALRLPPLPGVFVGTTFVHAFLAFDGTGVHFASNPVRVTIDP